MTLSRLVTRIQEMLASTYALQYLKMVFGSTLIAWSTSRPDFVLRSPKGMNSRFGPEVVYRSRSGF